MADVPLRELRNHTADVLRRVEQGERVTILVDRRPVALLVPLPRRRRWVPAAEVEARLQGKLADRELLTDVHELLDERIGDL